MILIQAVLAIGSTLDW